MGSRKKTYLVPDAHSRALVFEPEECEDLTIDTAVTCLKADRNPALNEVIAFIEHNYHLVTYDIIKPKHPATQYNRVWSRLFIHVKAGKQLILMDSAQIVIPTCS